MELKPEHCIAEGSGPTPCCNAISVYTRSRPLVVENGVYLFSHPARLGTTGGTQSEKHLNYGMYPKGIVNNIVQRLRNSCRFSLAAHTIYYYYKALVGSTLAREAIFWVGGGKT